MSNTITYLITFYQAESVHEYRCTYKWLFTIWQKRRSCTDSCVYQCMSYLDQSTFRHTAGCKAAATASWWAYSLDVSILMVGPVLCSMGSALIRCSFDICVCASDGVYFVFCSLHRLHRCLLWLCERLKLKDSPQPETYTHTHTFFNDVKYWCVVLTNTCLLPCVRECIFTFNALIITYLTTRFHDNNNHVTTN